MMLKENKAMNFKIIFKVVNEYLLYVYMKKKIKPRQMTSNSRSVRRIIDVIMQILNY